MQVNGVDVGNTPAEVRIVVPTLQKDQANNVQNQATGEDSTRIIVSPLPEMKGRLMSKTLVFKTEDHPSGSTLVFDLRENNPFPLNPINLKLDSIRKIPKIQKVEKKVTGQSLRIP